MPVRPRLGILLALLKRGHGLSARVGFGMQGLSLELRG